MPVCQSILLPDKAQQLQQQQQLFLLIQLLDTNKSIGPETDNLDSSIRDVLGPVHAENVFTSIFMTNQWWQRARKTGAQISLFQTNHTLLTYNIDAYSPCRSLENDWEFNYYP